MSRKAFEVTVELDVQAVTCPGVWLCPTGKVTLRVCMLGSTAKTLKKSPVFPLLYHEKFIFRKTICSARFLTDLQREFAKEVLYAELVQWQGGDYGTVLATFESSLEELLFPSPCERGLIAGVDIDLLMEPASCFPGILAPKIEVSTKTTIDEVVNAPKCDNEAINIINPKLLSSKQSCPSQIRRQRKVCHSRPRKCRRLRGRPCGKRNLQERRPPFVVRHVEDDILMLDPICSPAKRCCKPRCGQCSLGPPQPVWNSGHAPCAKSPCPYPSPRDPSPCTTRPWSTADFTPCDPSPRPPYEKAGCRYCNQLQCPISMRTRSLSPLTKPLEQKTCVKSTPATVPCRHTCNTGGDCQICGNYKRYFDVCNRCRYPIIPTKRYPQGCACDVSTPKPKPSVYECRNPQGELKQTLPEPSCYGQPDMRHCRKYPLLSCSEYPCGRKCTQCLLNPCLPEHSVERSTALPRHVDKPSYREAFYLTLEKFYKKLYKRAKSRAMEEVYKCPC